MPNTPRATPSTPATTMQGSPDTSNRAKGPEQVTTTTLEALQTTEQRSVLDVIGDLRKCGLEGVLPLPQLVVCGDTSVGKSSVLEALTEVPFPRSDNICTRFATEIILRRDPTDSIAVKIIPDPTRFAQDKERIEGFKETITNFQELWSLVAKAKLVMGIDDGSSEKLTGKSQAFSKDVLSIEISGPSRPQLTLVDLPGLIQNVSNGVTTQDVQLIQDITQHYLSQSRTISLAVVAATNFYPNQSILTKVRQVDPYGDRTLGIITKPDRLPPGSGDERAFLKLAQNQDIFLKLGWHILKNRAYEEDDYSHQDRNLSEMRYLSGSIFAQLPREHLGIDALVVRLSQLLFGHIKRELPSLRRELDTLLLDTENQIQSLGKPRVTAQDCRHFLMQMSLNFYEVCTAAVSGHYEGEYFSNLVDEKFAPTAPATVLRLRAVVQFRNGEFSDLLRRKGHKFQIDTSSAHDEDTDDESDDSETEYEEADSQVIVAEPKSMTYPKALKWVHEVLRRTRGREMEGNFNPLLIGELFWEQSCNWRTLAKGHLDVIEKTCFFFFDVLLERKCPEDVRARLVPIMRGSLAKRYQSAMKELESILEDVQSYPINYNHYYMDTIKKQRWRRELASATSTRESTDPRGSMDSQSRIVPSMSQHSCEEALDCLMAIYKVRVRADSLIALISTDPRTGLRENLHRQHYHTGY